jgi:osmotically inducible protein OsmC
MKRSTATVQWKGTLDGSGLLSTESGALNRTAVSWRRRMGVEPGTNPEELLAGAHATCYAMSLAHRLEDKGWPPAVLDVTAVCVLEQQEFGGIAIRDMELSVSGRVPGIAPEMFVQLAEKTLEHCPVSKALVGNVNLHVAAHLQGVEVARHV